MIQLHGAQRAKRVFAVSVAKRPGPCIVTLREGVAERSIYLAGDSAELLKVPCVSTFDLTAPEAVAVDAPHSLESVEIANSVLEPDWVSPRARPFEERDIVADGQREALRLSDGWAPREMVNGSPVRWLGTGAALELDPHASHKELVISGIVGPCLGRGAGLALFVDGNPVMSSALDLEDGQPFSVTFDVSEHAGATAEFVVNRPLPRFTPHDSRTLNLLVKEVSLR